VTALDVLEHVPDDRAVVRDFHRVLKPGGVAVITVPASMALWSDWDEALHHFRRYDRRGLVALFDPGQWELVHVNYTNVVLYPAVWLVRRWRRWFPARPGAARAEDRVPHHWINGFLRALFVRTGLARLLRGRLRARHTQCRARGEPADRGRRRYARLQRYGLGRRYGAAARPRTR